MAVYFLMDERRCGDAFLSDAHTTRGHLLKEKPPLTSPLYPRRGGDRWAAEARQSAIRHSGVSQRTSTYWESTLFVVFGDIFASSKNIDMAQLPYTCMLNLIPKAHRPAAPPD